MRQSRHQLIAVPAAMLRAPLSALAFAAALLFTAVLFTAVPASAHDAAESTAPTNGSTVAAVPDRVSVTFSNKPLALGSQIQVNDSTGTNWADGPVEIVDNVASQKVKQGAPAGKFTVVWRVVSSDSHPIEGTFGFTASSGSGGTGPTAPVATAGTAQPPVAGQTGAGGEPGQGTASESSQPLPWSIIILAAVALGLLVFLGATARRKLAAGSGDETAVDDAAEATGGQPDGGPSARDQSDRGPSAGDQSDRGPSDEGGPAKP